jgi:hypothetical protein
MGISAKEQADDVKTLPEVTVDCHTIVALSLSLSLSLLFATISKTILDPKHTLPLHFPVILSIIIFSNIRVFHCPKFNSRFQ